MSEKMIVKGMYDVYDLQMQQYQYVCKAITQVLDTYHYQPIITPILEQTHLFVRSIGEATDIVEKEIYQFIDKDGQSLSLRPELTASVVRAVIESGKMRQKNINLYQIGACFRRERPQKGRYRQFFQATVESFGSAQPFVEIEHLLMIGQIFKNLNIQTSLHINSLGQLAERKNYIKSLQKYCFDHSQYFDEQALLRVKKNPLRILDTKDKKIITLLKDAPKISNFISNECRKHFDIIINALERFDIAYKIDEHLVRGLDYYNRTVYEWKTNQLGSQDTLCAGGRYDNLTEYLGGKPTSAAGFAIGIDRVGMLSSHKASDLAVALLWQDDISNAYQVAQAVGSFCPVFINKEIQSLNGQIKVAKKRGIKYALICQPKLYWLDFKTGCKNQVTLDEVVLKLQNCKQNPL